MTPLIAIDWGTTSFRAYQMSDTGEIVEKRQSAGGILSVEGGQFAAALTNQIGDWLDADDAVPIVMSGMIGSRQGWHEVDYVSGQPGLAEIADGMQAVTLDHGREIWIAPGYSCLNANGQTDVMRGEETQIVGASATSSGPQIYCLPGTHSKWALVDEQRITGFTTFMTGEVFDVLCRHSILGKLMSDSETDQEQAETWFDEGVQKAKAGMPLLSGFFGVRARALFSEIPETGTKPYLSGLLIGTEIRDAYQTDMPEVTLIGSGHLIGLYRRAIEAFGGRAILADENLAAVGLYQLARQKGLLG